jgi:hypothetical protein
MVTGWKHAHHSKAVGVTHHLLIWSLFVLTVLGFAMHSRLVQ